MKILGMDLETSSLDTDNCAVREIGAILWDTDVEADCPVKIFTEFVKDEKSPEKNKYDICSEVCGITRFMIEGYGIPAAEVIDSFQRISADADYILAANGNGFDHPVWTSFTKRYGMPESEKPWIDLIQDVPFPEDCKGRNLLYLCAYHGFLNPFPHRAAFDVMSMLKIFRCYELDTVIQYFNSPWIHLIAHVSYNDRQLAKDYGFGWQPNLKTWYRNFREYDAVNGREKMDGFEGFKVSLREGKVERE